MDDVSFANLFGVCLIAFLVPFTLAFFPRLRLPAIVVELLAGIVAGPSVLGWVRVDDTVNVIAALGLSYLLFLAGFDLDLDVLRGRTLRVALLGFGLSLMIAVALGGALSVTGAVLDPMLVGIILAATGLGVVLPVLKDAGQLATGFGRTVISNATIAEFATIVLLALLFSTNGLGPVAEAGLLVVLGLVAAAAAIALARLRDHMAAGPVLRRLADSSSQLRVRLALALLLGMLAISESFGFEAILGAFIAGALLNVLELDRGAEGSRFARKLEAIGFGFFIPVFFVTSGLRYDLPALVSSPGTMLKVPLFVGAILLVRGVPALLYRRTMGRRQVVAAGLLQSTTLSFILAATAVGVELGIMTQQTSTALIAAGVITVVCFPVVALGLLRRGDTDADAALTEEPAQPSPA
jgi:Kef-type K+ transport system membrane component KefB